MSTGQICGTFSDGMLVSDKRCIEIPASVQVRLLPTLGRMRTVYRLYRLFCSLCMNRNVRTEILYVAVSCANMTVFTYLFCGTGT